LFCNKDDIVAYCEGLRPQNGHVNVDRTLTISGQQFLFGLYNTFIQCFMVQPVLKRKTILLLRCECRSGLQRAVRTCTWRKALKIEATCSSEDRLTDARATGNAVLSVMSSSANFLFFSKLKNKNM